MSDDNLPQHPYPGLRAFEREEWATFFGRQDHVDQLLQRLKDHHFLAVIGASGSGKSSLMKAGVLHALAQGYMGSAGANWSIAELRPGDQPFARLAEALLKDATFSQAWNPHGERPEAFLTAALRAGSRSLLELLQQHPLPDGTRLLVLVDQFEELFRFEVEDQAVPFVALLLAACRDRSDIYVAITMRSDFLGNTVAFQGLPEAINDGLYLTPRLDREQLHEAITSPALLFGGDIEDTLANHLINEASTDPDQLPLLQHALMRLWQGEAQPLTLADYQAAQNTLKNLLDQHVEEIWQTLSPLQKQIAKTLFRALTERNRDGQEIRRPVKFATLLTLLPDSNEADWQAVIQAFRQEGRNFLMPPPKVVLTPDTTLDISHESLIRQWQRLQGWIKDEGDIASLYARLCEDSAQHHTGRGELWSGKNLASVLDWQSKNHLLLTLTQAQAGAGKQAEVMAQQARIKIFIAQSQQAEELRLAAEHAAREAEEARKAAEMKQIKRQRWWLTVGLLLMAGLAGWAMTERNEAKSERNRAEIERSRAESERNRAESERNRAEKEVVHAIEAEQKAKDAEELAITQSFELDMVNIPAGTFAMGCQDGRDIACDQDEKPLHNVALNRFHLGKYEVTQGQWRVIMGNNPSNFKDCGSNCPVERVSWEEIQNFLRKLNEKTGSHYRLPSESEWEYACRGGESHIHCGNNDADAVAWYTKNSGDKTHPVGGKQGNAFGLYDMSGNVWEWVQDSKHRDYNGAPNDGSVWEGTRAEARVLRGGSWGIDPQNVRAANRFRNEATYRNGNTGFRLARTLP